MATRKKKAPEIIVIQDGVKLKSVDPSKCKKVKLKESMTTTDIGRLIIETRAKQADSRSK